MATLTDEQKDKVYNWVKLGYRPSEVVNLAKLEGWDVSLTQVTFYRDNAEKHFQNQLAMKRNQNDWFSREFRAQKAADILQLLYDDIMSGKQYAEEITEGKMGTTVKPIYNGALVKNWNDTAKTIAQALGQDKQEKDITYKADKSLSEIIGKIYEQDTTVQGVFKEAEIVELPPADGDFSDDKEFAEMVKKQADTSNIPSLELEFEEEEE